LRNALLLGHISAALDSAQLELSILRLDVEAIAEQASCAAVPIHLSLGTQLPLEQVDANVPPETKLFSKGVLLNEL
jgi:hypothetical protein